VGGGGGDVIRKPGLQSGGRGEAYLNISRFSTELRDICKILLGEHLWGKGVCGLEIG
jgi:hypothetical protein